MEERHTEELHSQLKAAVFHSQKILQWDHMVLN
jgi:hypothetical protein